MENNEHNNPVESEAADQKQQADQVLEQMKKQESAGTNQPYPYPNNEKKKMSTLAIVGIVLLVVIGIPLLLFGACILVLTGGNF